MLFLWTVVAFNFLGAHYPVPGFIHPNQNIVTRAKGAFMAACTARSVSRMAKNIYHTNIHHTNIYHTSRQDESSVGTAVGFPNVTSLSVYRMRAPDDDFRCWEWESGPEQPFIPPFIPPSEEASWYLISANAAYALVKYTRRQRGFSSHSQDSKRKTELAHGSREGTTSSSVDVDNCSSNAETAAPPNSERETSANLVKEPKGKEVAWEPPTMPADSHSEVGPSSPNLAGQQSDTEQVNLEEPAATEGDANSVSSRLRPSKCRPSKARRDRAKRRLAHEAAEAAQFEAEANADAPSGLARKSKGKEAVRDPPTSLADFPTEADAALAVLAEAGATGYGQMLEGAVETFTPLADSLPEASTTDGPKNKPSQKKRRQLARREAEAALAAQDEAESADHDQRPEGAGETFTAPADSPPEAGPSFSHLAGQQPDDMPVDPEETATIEGEATSTDVPKPRLSRRMRRRAREQEAVALAAQAEAGGPS